MVPGGLYERTYHWDAAGIIGALHAALCFSCSVLVLELSVIECPPQEKVVVAFV